MKLKLSNKQVEVLANEIYSELEKEANKYKESEEYINFENSLKDNPTYKTWKKLDKAFDKAVEDGLKVDKYYRNSVMAPLRDLINTERNKKFKVPYLPGRTEITNKIILNTIDVDNLEDLISKVKESLTAKK